MIKILKVKWRSNLETIGIVLIENGIGQQSVRIGPREKLLGVPVGTKKVTVII